MIIISIIHIVVSLFYGCYDIWWNIISNVGDFNPHYAYHNGNFFIVANLGNNNNVYGK